MFKRRPSSNTRASSHHALSNAQPEASITPGEQLLIPGMMPQRRASGTVSVNPSTSNPGGCDSLGVGVNRTFVSILKDRTSSLGLFDKKAGGLVGNREMPRGADEGGSAIDLEEAMGDEEGYLLVAEDDKVIIPGASLSANLEGIGRVKVEALEGRKSRSSTAFRSRSGTSVRSEQAAAPLTSHQDAHADPTRCTQGSASPSRLLRRKTIPKPVMVSKLKEPGQVMNEQHTGASSYSIVPAGSGTSAELPQPLSASSTQSSFENIPRPDRASQTRRGLPVSTSQRTLRSTHAHQQGFKGKDGKSGFVGLEASSRVSAASPVDRIPSIDITRRATTASSRLPRPHSIVPLREPPSTDSIAHDRPAVTDDSSVTPPGCESMRSISLGLRLSQPATSGTIISARSGKLSSEDVARSKTGIARSSMQLRPRTSDGSSRSSGVGSQRTQTGVTQTNPAHGFEDARRARRPASMAMIGSGRALSKSSELGGVRSSGPAHGQKLSDSPSLAGNEQPDADVVHARGAALERLNGIMATGDKETLFPNPHAAKGPPRIVSENTLVVPLSRSSPSPMATPTKLGTRPVNYGSPSSRPGQAIPPTTAVGTPSRLPRSVGLAPSTSTNLSRTPSKSSPLRPSPGPSPKMSTSSPSSSIAASPSGRNFGSPGKVTSSRSMPIPMPATHGPSPLAQRLYRQPTKNVMTESLTLDERDRKSSAASTASDIDVRMAKSLARSSMTFDGLVGTENSPLSRRVRYDGMGKGSPTGGGAVGLGDPSEKDTRLHAGAGDLRGLTSKTSFSGLSAISITSEDDIRTAGRSPPVPPKGSLADSPHTRHSSPPCPLEDSHSTRKDLLALFAASTDALQVANAYAMIVAACEAELRVLEAEKRARGFMVGGVNAVLRMTDSSAGIGLVVGVES